MKAKLIGEVESARRCYRPAFIPIPKGLKGTKAMGLAYEKAVLGAIRKRNLMPSRGQWWEYETDLGFRKWCQTDIVMEWPERAIVFECKLTRWEEAKDQLEGLYLPVLRKALEKPVFGVITLRSLVGLPREVSAKGSLGEILGIKDWREEELEVLHYLGRGPI